MAFSPLLLTQNIFFFILSLSVCVCLQVWSESLVGSLLTSFKVVANWKTFVYSIKCFSGTHIGPWKPYFFRKIGFLRKHRVSFSSFKTHLCLSLSWPKPLNPHTKLKLCSSTTNSDDRILTLSTHPIRACNVICVDIVSACPFHNLFSSSAES